MNWRRSINPNDSSLYPGTGRGSRVLAISTLSFTSSIFAKLEMVTVTFKSPDARSLLLLVAIIYSLAILIISVLTKKYRALLIALASIAAIVALLYFRS